MPPIPPHIVANLRKNTAALRETKSPLADRLENMTWPDDLKFINALDGTPSAFSRQLSQSGWFSASSAPSVRDVFVCDHFTAESSNVVFPGAGHGVGLKRVLDRLGSYQSVFVWETQILPLALLLGLHDFSRELSDRRLVFLISEDLKKEMVDYIRAYPEMVIPCKIINWPWVPEHRMQELTLIMEQTVGELNACVSQKVESLSNELESIVPVASAGTVRRLGVFSLSPQPRAVQMARDLASAAGRLQLEPETYLLDHPLRSSGVGVLKHLVHSRPDAILSVGVEKRRWGVKLPERTPFVAVLGAPGVILGAEALKEVVPSGNEVFVVGAREDAEILKEKMSPDRLLVMDIAVNPDAFKPEPRAVDTQIVLFADWIDSDPEKVGIRQQSHQHLWREIGKAIASNPLGYRNARAEDIVERVSNVTGIVMSDKEVRSSFSMLVRNVLAPDMVPSEVVRLLTEAGISLRVFGSGWKDHPRFSGLSEAVPSDAGELNRIVNSCALVMYLDNESNWRQIVFDSLCAGRPVLVKTLSEGRFPAAPELVHGLVKLHAGVDLVAQVKDALADQRQLNERALKTRSFLAEHYCYERVLGRVLTAIAKVKVG